MAIPSQIFEFDIQIKSTIKLGYYLNNSPIGSA